MVCGVVIVVGFVVVPGTADAQRRAQARPGSHGTIVVARPYYPVWYYGGWYPWGPYGYPYYWYPPLYGYGVWDGLTTSVRLEIDQRDAEVFVDGYRAGVVNDFDGTFQRLRLRPGSHEIVVYSEGYRTIREHVYMSSGSDKKIKMTMERLSPGESSERPSPPAPPGAGDTDDPDQPGGVGSAREGHGSQPEIDPRHIRQALRPTGILSLRVQPGDAEIVVNGEQWGVGAGQAQVAIELPEGRHRIEVRKPGFAPYTQDVLIRYGVTLRLSVDLRAAL
jgi:hypothetical protein